MAVTATVRFTMTVTETLDLNIDGSSSPNIQHSAFDKTKALDALGTGSTGPVVATYVATVPLVAGAKTIDLTALPQAGGGTHDATGQKLQAMRVENPSTNANNIVITDGAANGYNFLGDASGQITLLPGCIYMAYWDDKLDDVAAADKTIDFAGTGTQAFNITLLVG